jgi:hypothetical protein
MNHQQVKRLMTADFRDPIETRIELQGGCCWCAQPVSAYLYPGSAPAAVLFQQRATHAAAAVATDVFVCDAPSFQCLLLLPLLRRSQVSSG